MKLPEECRVAYHHSCHMLRELHGHDQPLQLLDDVEGCTRVEWTASTSGAAASAACSA